MIEADGQWRGIDANSDIGGRVRHVTSINDFEEADRRQTRMSGLEATEGNGRLEDLGMTGERDKTTASVVMDNIPLEGEPADRHDDGRRTELFLGR